MENEVDTNELNVERTDNGNSEIDTRMREHVNENSSVETTVGFHDYRIPPPDYEECVLNEYYRTHGLVSCDTQTDPVPCQCRCHSEGDRNGQVYYRHLHGEHSSRTGYTPFICTQPIPGRNFSECLHTGYQDENVPLTVHYPMSTVNSTVGSSLPHHNTNVVSPLYEKDKEMKVCVGILIAVIIISGVIYFSISLSLNN